MAERSKELILFDAARFLQSDAGDTGFFGRFAEAVPGNPYLVASAMGRTLRAANRAGQFITVLNAGEFAVHQTETGATCVTSVARNEETDGLQLAVLIGDSEGPVPDLAVRTTFMPDAARATHITDNLGMLTAQVLGQTVEIAFGQGVLLRPELSE